MSRGSYPRRYDLDALRAAAMLLGIVLHAGLSFVSFPWPVQDTQQNEVFWLLFAAIHGFRMPVFFVLSGFFTAMLWRGRGLKALLSHRFRRVLLPFLLGLVTIIPAVNWISGWAIASAFEASVAKAEEDSIWSAARNGHLAAMERHLKNGADINGIDPASGQTPLVWAALVGRVEAVDWLLQNGDAVNGRTKDGGTPLLAAAFLGRVQVAKRLLQHGADTEASNNNGDTPRTALAADWELTLRPRKQNHPLCVGFVVLAVRGARTAGHWCSIGRARLAAFSSGKILLGFSRRYRPFIANLPVSRPLHLAEQTAEWPSRPPDELALHTHIRKGILISAVRRIVEEDETHFIETIVLYEKLLYRIERGGRGERDRVAVHAGADGREGNRLDAVLQCES